MTTAEQRRKARILRDLHSGPAVLVLVRIEHAPDLVEVSTCTSSRLALQVFPGTTDESVGCHPAIREIEVYTGVAAHPHEEVVRFRSLALRQHAKNIPRGALLAAASLWRPAGGLPHDPATSAA